MSKIYLLPTPISLYEPLQIITDQEKKILQTLRWFLVEDVRTARRFLLSMKLEGFSLQEIQLDTLDKHTDTTQQREYIQKVLMGNSVGILSEAGCPAVMDPGNQFIALAQKNNIHVVPVAGPSSLMLSLMASGLNGQNFTFHGYFPIPKEECIQKIKQVEREIQKQGNTHIFVETPYRNQKVLETILTTAQNTTYLCIACEITSEAEYIQTKSILQWKQTQVDIQKKNCVFLFGNFVEGF
ncbi:MAG: SAM-dependent methyltransferase [Chitinophagaceae bacterium]|nr:SAM-dependent methyltransferase [Chitinophagaceae bacterium]